jgi:hypothetical protein
MVLGRNAMVDAYYCKDRGAGASCHIDRCDDVGVDHKVADWPDRNAVEPDKMTNGAD